MKSYLVKYLVAALGLTVLTANASRSSDYIANFNKSSISLMQAVEKANQELKGTPLSVEFKRGDNTPYYKVEIVANNQEYEVQIDPQTGNILQSKQDNDKVLYAKTSLSQAITIAEKEGGKVSDIELVRKRGKTFYKVQLIKDNQLQHFAIDADNGQLLDKHSKKRKHSHSRKEKDNSHKH